MKKLTFLLTVLVTNFCLARTIEVPEEFQQIQTAIDSSFSGDTVLVAPGVYKELINFNGKNIVLTSHYLFNEDSTTIDSTIIDADRLGTVVTIESGEDSTMQLIGLTIQGGLWDDNSPVGHGVGIKCTNNSSPKISNSVIKDNKGFSTGGVYIKNSKIILQNVSLINNKGTSYGNADCGGIKGNNSDIILINCTIKNSRGDYSGALYLSNTRIHLENIFMTGNSGSEGYGCIWANSNSNIDIVNSKISDNNSYQGIFNINSSTINISNSELLRNKSDEGVASIRLNESEFYMEKSKMVGGDYWTSGFYTTNSKTTIYKSIITSIKDQEAPIIGSDSEFKIINSTLYGNTDAGTDISDCISIYNCDLYIMNSIIWNEPYNQWSNNTQIDFSNSDGKTNDLQIINSNIYKDQEKITVNSSTEMVYENNIYEDPNFVSVDLNDFHINYGSPCIDAGTQLMMNGSDTIFYIPDEDFSSNTPDIGAYEFPFKNMHHEYLDTEEFLVNTTIEGDQIEPVITTLSNIEFVIGWINIAENFRNNYGSIQKFGYNFAKSSNEKTIATKCYGNLSITSLVDEKFIVNWKYLDAGTEINMNIIDGENHNISRIDYAPFNDSNNGGSIKLSKNRFVTCYSRYDVPGGEEFDIYFEIFSMNGETILDQTMANTTIPNSQDYPAVTSLPNGDFIITWQSEGNDGLFDIYAQRFDSTGAKLGGELQVNTYTKNHQRDPYITYLPENKMLIVWESYFQDDSKKGVFGQILDIEGNKVGKEFQINTFNIGDQQEPVATAKSNGEFAVSWQSGAQDGSGNGIFLQRFDNDANMIGTEMQVNTTIDWSQNNPAMTTLDNDDIIICWQSNGQDDDGWSIIAKKLPADYSTSVDEDNNNKIVEDFILRQNYPNPFNPTTSISYSIPKQSNVKLTIYDLRGNEIETLVNEQKSIGNYKVNFDATGLSSGIYFYRLQVGDEYVETMKMIFLK